ncbi:MAG: hypothetical protein HY238_23405 [Acidobacteria bacterium]|nr:hypothetical protein [Acidobacteriota bacterium]
MLHSARIMKRRFWHSLLAVLLGNAVYFAVSPKLPYRAQHRPFELDWGLAVDFWLCLVFYGLLAGVKWFRSGRGK